VHVEGHSQPTGEHNDPNSDESSEPCSEEASGMTARADGELPTRSMESVSVREIGNGDSTWSWQTNFTDVGALARDRGIDREFALRELVTTQMGSSGVTTRTETWDNWLDDHEATGRDEYTPNDARSLVRAIAEIVHNDKSGRIRAIGAGHSHSRASRPDDNYLKLSYYGSNNQSLGGLVGDLPKKWQKPDKSNVTHYDHTNSHHTTRRLAAGNTIKYLNRKVLFDDDQALLNMGSFDAQTLAGAINTSTHGTGLELGTLADSVLSVEMVTVTESPAVDDEPLVRHFRIEPTDGITDRSSFEADVGEHGMTLVQDDEIFHSAVVGYGAMGVATGYTLKVRDRFYLRETTEVRPWDDLKNDLDTYKQANSNNRQFQILLNTQSIHDPTTPRQMCLVTKFEEKNWQPDPNERDEKGSFRKFRDSITGGGTDPLTDNPLLATIMTEAFFRNQMDGPQFDGSQKTASYIALRRLRDNNYSNPEAPPSDPQLGMSTEVAVPVEKVDEAMDHLINNVVDNVQINGSKVRFAVPSGIRFTKASRHKLSPEFKLPGRSNGVAMIEVPFNVQPVNALSGKVNSVVWSLIWLGIGPSAALAMTPVGAAALAAFTITVAKLLPSRDISQSKMLEYSKQALDNVESALSGGRFNGRPHLGKFNQVGEPGSPSLDDIYPTDELRIWLRVLTQFNAFGTFNNSFTSKLDIDVKRDNDGTYTPLGETL
jgi:hypothetical protein